MLGVPSKLARMNQPDPTAEDPAAQAITSIRRLVHELRKDHRRTERKVGLSIAQLFVLRVIAGKPGACLGDLAAATCTDLSSVSVVCTRLVERGLVVRGTSADDARRAHLCVTARGRALASQAGPAHASARLLAALRELPAARIREFASTLEDVLGSMGAADAPARLFFEDDRRRPNRQGRTPRG